MLADDGRDGLEIDHRIPFAEGGATTMDNLPRLCRWHHYLKSHKGYNWGVLPGRLDVDRSRPAASLRP